MFDKLIKLLMYGSTDGSLTDNVDLNISESNRNNLFVYSLVAGIGLVVMLGASLFDDSLVKNRTAYFLCLLVCAVLAVVSHRCKKDNKHLIYLCVYVFAGMLYAFGIALGTFVEPKEVSVSFPILLFAVPLLFTDIPIRMILSCLFAIGAYIAAALYTQDMVMFGYNMSNILPYGIISMTVSTYMIQIKVRRHILENDNKYLIESDQLTGMLNRRCFEQHVQLLRKNQVDTGMLICAFDVNGLKMVNDNLGHHAGDELIRGAANCIEGVFGNYGHCYRTGGDEFMAILNTAAPTPDELRKQFACRCSCFKGTYVSGLSVSAGMVMCHDGDPVDELIKQADKEMYSDKQKYYQTINRLC